MKTRRHEYRSPQRNMKILLVEDKELYQRLKDTCARRGMFVTFALRQAVRDWLEKNER
jgi:hypothetical protein